MNVQDRIAQILLPLFDAVMNLITFGIWNTIRGEQRPALKIKK